MRGRYVAAVAALLAAGAIVACLNPQPLPPSDFAGEATNDSDASTRSDAGSFGQDPDAPPSADAGVGANGEGGTPADGDGGDGGDAGDAGDGGDAGLDADAG